MRVAVAEDTILLVGKIMPEVMVVAVMEQLVLHLFQLLAKQIEAVVVAAGLLVVVVVMVGQAALAL
jgi:hypothetical protein